MEEFEGLLCIIDSLGIKGSTLNLFEIKWKTPSSDEELKKFVQIPYGPHDKAFPTVPCVTVSNGRELTYSHKETLITNSILEYDDSKFDSDVELDEFSMSTNLTQFMNEYTINDKIRNPGDRRLDFQSLKNPCVPLNVLSKILPASYDELVEENRVVTSEFTQLSSNNWNPDISTTMLTSEKEELTSLKSEPFADLELDNFGYLHL